MIHQGPHTRPTTSQGQNQQSLLSLHLLWEAPQLHWQPRLLLGSCSLSYPRWKATAPTVAFLAQAAGTTTGSTLHASLQPSRERSVRQRGLMQGQGFWGTSYWLILENGPVAPKAFSE